MAKARPDGILEKNDALPQGQLRLPSGYNVPSRNLFRVDLIQYNGADTSLNDWSEIGSALVAGGALATFDPRHLTDKQLHTIGQIQRDIADACATYCTERVHEIHAPEFRKSLKDGQKLIDSLLHWSLRTSVYAEIAREIDNSSELLKKFQNEFPNAKLRDGFDLYAQSDFMLNIASKTIANLLENTLKKGRPTDHALHQFINTLAAIYLAFTGKRAGRSGGAGNSGLTPFERFACSCITTCRAVTVEGIGPKNDPAYTTASPLKLIQTVLDNRKSSEKR